MTRKEQAAQTRGLLVEVALALFVEQGYNETPISQILSEAGLARGALYHHFPDGKKQLFVEVVDVVDHRLHAGFEQIITTITSPLAQIQAGFDLLVRLAADRVFARIILIEAAAVMPGAWAIGSEYALLRDALQRAIAAGEIKPIPLDAATSTLFGAARRAADFVANSDEPLKTAAECSEVLGALLNGLVTKPSRSVRRGSAP